MYLEDVCDGINSCSRYYANNLWGVIMTNKFAAITTLAFNYYSTIFPALIIFYSKKLYYPTTQKKLINLIKILIALSSAYYIYPLLLSFIEIFFHQRLIALVMIRTVFFAQIVSLPLYYLAFIQKDFTKEYSPTEKLLIMLGTFFVYTVIFIIYLFTYSEYKIY
jgi:hypothetical protein